MTKSITHPASQEDTMVRSLSSSASIATTCEPGSLRLAIPVLVLIALLGLTTSFWFFARFHDYYTNDSYSYETAAKNLVAGHGFTNAAGYPEMIRTPGYPLLIAPFIWLNAEPKYLLVFQHLLRVVTAVATAAVGFRLTRSRMQAMIAGIVVCLDLPMVEAANTIMTEMLYTAVLGIVLWVLWEAGKHTKAWAWSSTAGLPAGAMTLIRPVGLFFFVPAALYLLLVRKSFRLRSAVCFVLAFACPLLLWGGRNYSRTGSFVLFPISGWEMLGYRAAGVLAIDEPGDFYANMENRRAQLVNEVCDQMKERYGPPCIPLIGPQAAIPEKSAYYMSLGRQIVLQHPLAYVKLALRGAGVMMLGGDAARVSQLTGIRQRSAALLLLIYTVPVLCFGLAGTWSYWRSNRQLFWLLFLTMAYFVGITAGAEAYSRYRVPVVPVYAVLVAAGVDFGLHRLRTRAKP